MDFRIHAFFLENLYDSMIRSENLLDEMQCSMDYWMLVWEFIFVPLHLVSFILKSVELLVITITR